MRDLLNPEAPKHGEVGRGRDRVRNTNSKASDTESYALRRLKRDRPELAHKVIQGEMSANAAAIEAGFRTKTVSVPVMKDGERQIERAGQTLIKHFEGDTWALAQYLMAHAERPVNSGH